MTFLHFARIFSRSSGEDSATGGKSFIHSNGRQASMTARELKPFLPVECAGRAGRSSSGAGSRWTPPDRSGSQPPTCYYRRP